MQPRGADVEVDLGRLFHLGQVDLDGQGLGRARQLVRWSAHGRWRERARELGTSDGSSLRSVRGGCGWG